MLCVLHGVDLSDPLPWFLRRSTPVSFFDPSSQVLRSSPMAQQHFSKVPQVAVWLIATIPATAFAQNPVQVLRADNPVSYVSVSTDSKLVAAGCDTYSKQSGSILVWDMKTGRQLQTLNGYPFALAGLSFLQDDKHLIFAGLGSTARIHNIRTGKEVARLSTLSELTALCPVGNSGVFGTFDEKGVRLWDCSTPEAPKQAKKSPRVGNGSKGVFSIDGRFWVEAINSTTLNESPPSAPCRITVWDVASGKVLQQFQGQQNNVRHLAISPDRKLLAITYLFGPPNNVEVRNLKDGKILFTGSSDGLPTSIAFSPNGKYLVVGSAKTGTIMIWDVTKKTFQKKVKAHTGTVRSLVFTSNSRYLVSGSADHTVKIWNVKDLE